MSSEKKYILMLYEYSGPYRDSTRPIFKRALYFSTKGKLMTYLNDNGFVNEKIYKKKKGSDDVFVNKKKKIVGGIIVARKPNIYDDLC